MNAARFTTLLLILSILPLNFPPGGTQPIPHASFTSFTVNSPGDQGDPSPGNICDTAYNPNVDPPIPASGLCTLRAALSEAASTPQVDLIQFDIGSSLIQPQASLGADSVIIQGGAARVVIDGALLPVSTPILRLYSNAVIDSLVINHGLNVGGILISGDNNTVANSYIGVSPDGMSAQGNQWYGIEIWGDNNTIGAGNLISGNQGDGIKITASAAGTIIRGNYIGVNAAGTAPIPNTGAGIAVEMSSGSTIGGVNGVTPGGACSGDCNLISGNQYYGIDLWGSSSNPAQNNLIKGNFIGTDVSGTASIAGHLLGGISVSSAYASGNTLGGLEPTERNLVSGGNSSGILLKNGAHHNLVLGNYVGVNTSGDSALGSQTAGIVLDQAHYNTIGAPRGTDDKCRGGCNLVSGNTIGIEIQNAAAFNTVLGNFAGSSWDGVSAVPNSDTGIWIYNAQDNTIGGVEMGAGNLPAWNGGSGIGISGETSARNKVIGNVVGTDLYGQANRGNSGHGIFVYGVANQVGGLQVGEGNRVAYNAQNGIYLSHSSFWPSYQNRIAGNAIYSNGKLGIELLTEGAAPGVSPNDEGDGDEGANQMQNYPVITALERSGPNTTITAALHSKPSTTYRIEFFNNPGCDSSGYGEGKTFLGAQDVTTGLDGIAAFSATYANVTAITATAADPDGNTSEFSQCLGPITVNSTADRQDQDANDGACFTGQNTALGQPECTLRAAIQHANALPGTDSILFDIPGGGIPLIQPASALPPVIDSLFLDGSSQPGSGRVHLDGDLAGANAHGLHLTSTGSEISGFAITNFSGSGIYLQGGGGSVVRNCWIGLGPDPYAYMGNEGVGVWIENSPNNLIGGAGSANRNIISYNHQTAVWIDGSASDRNRVQNNFIGLLPSGESDAGGNGGHGVWIREGSSSLVGGFNAGEGNRIAYNNLNGVTIQGSGADENLVAGNAIFANTGLGIDLGNNGVTPNDDLDSDSGDNSLQNFPVLTDLARGKDSISGWIDSLGEHSFHLEFFASPACDSSGHGEGARYLGDMDVTTEASGSAPFTFLTQAHEDEVITVTATHPSGATSEFSECHGLVLQDIRLEQQRVSDGAWRELLSSGAVDGNQVKFKVTVRNRGALPETAELRFRNAITFAPLPGGNLTRVFAPGDTVVEYLWDTSGYAWIADKVARSTPLSVEVSLHQPIPIYEDRLYDLQKREILVRPRPVILVHGWNSDALGAWGAYEDILKGVHPLWQSYAVGDGAFPGVMDTGTITSFGKSLKDNAIIARDYIQAARELENAWHVDIIAHSKGGLISRLYIQDYMPLRLPDNRPMVSHLLMLGTPNLGSPCAVDVPGMVELTYDYVQRYFNPYIKVQHGVPYAVMAGNWLQTFPVICGVVAPNDMVVEVTSAWGLPYVFDVAEVNTSHTAMTTSVADFNKFVLPRLALSSDHFQSAPSAPQLAAPSQPLPWTQPLQNRQYIDTQPNLTLSAGQTLEIPISVPQADALDLVLAAAPEVTTSLYAPGGHQTWQVLAGSEFAQQPVISYHAEAPTAGDWRLVLFNSGSSDSPASVAASVTGAAFAIQLTTGSPDALNRLPITATLTNAGTPVTGAEVSAALVGIHTGQNGSGDFSLVLSDDGQHGDGLAGDGVYAALSQALPADQWIIRAKAVWNAQERAAALLTSTEQADYSLQAVVSASQASPGDTLTYTLTASNQGPSDSFGVTVTTSLPPALAFVSAASTLGAGQDRDCEFTAPALNGSLVTCTLSLPPAGQAVITIAARVISIPTSDGGLVTTTSTIQSAVFDPLASNNTSTAATTIRAQVFLPAIHK